LAAPAWRRLGGFVVQTIFGLLDRSANMLAQALEARLVETGLTAQEALVLRVVSENTDVDIARLRAAVGLRRSTTSSLLARLEGRGYVVRKPGGPDARFRVVEPTRVGAQLARIAWAVQQELEEELGGSVGPAEVAALEKISSAILRLPPVEIDPRDGLPISTA
jgi:DNA-binding MarR family transcriptional regulator